MNVANLELCKELKELSGWISGSDFFPVKHSTEDPIPAYDLGYLLRKLPSYIKLKNDRTRFTLRTKPESNQHELPLWQAMYGHDFSERADTPEDAAAKLAVELFKQGILTKEEA